MSDQPTTTAASSFPDDFYAAGENALNESGHRPATAATERVYAVGVIRCYDESGNEVETYVEGGPGKVSLIAMSDGTVRWAK